MSPHRFLPRNRATVLLTFLALVGMALPGVASAASSAPPLGMGVHPSAASGPIFLNLTATSAISFVPTELDVTPGASVHLRILQAADFNHTFTLSSVANFTIPSTDTPSDLAVFFAAHPPLVNLSLGDVAGSYHYANFTAPAVGTYEFVCYVATHFQSGMHGTLVSATSSSSSSGGGLDLTTLLIIVVVVVVVVALVAALVMRRRSRPKA